MQTDQIICERDGAVGRITFNNPERHNAMSYDMWVGGEAAIKQLIADGETRVIVLTGAGEKAFVAGADISKFEKERGTADAVAEYNAAVASFQKTLGTASLPTIAMIGGYAIGGGLAIALCCDIRIASDRAKFAESFVRLGIIPGDGGAWLLPRIVGMAKAAELAFTGDTIDAEEALACGLASKVVPHDTLMDEARDLAGRIARNPAHARSLPCAVRPATTPRAIWRGDIAT